MTDNVDDLSHLATWAREVASLPNHDRVKKILTDRWVGYTKAEEAVIKLEALISHPKRQRMPNLLIVGPTKFGAPFIKGSRTDEMLAT